MFNLALLGKQGWNLLTKPHTLAIECSKKNIFLRGTTFLPIWGLIIVLFGRVFGQQMRFVKLGYRMRIGSSEITSV